ncbi:NAD dependent epimerase/dehydratase family enzyme [Salinibacterium sp. CAN_S4]|uniref:epimerase n=1 Tax=Salinibacterium sp. CAN_S4 TaxID=2787727 RepID=UPI0018EF9C73
MAERIVIAGASGFIGTYLADRYRTQGATVSLIGRRGADARWGDTAAITGLIDGASVLINMAGKSVNCRYTDENRAEIMRSRVETTRELSDAITRCVVPPPLWINSSTATIYRHAEDRAMTESTGEIGTGFSVGIATAWERELMAAELPGTRRVALRMAIVLGDGSALVPLIRLARFGLGGAQLDGRWFSTKARQAAGTFHEFRAKGGKQKFSWIHIEDVYGIIEFIRADEKLSGPVNASAPHPTDNVSMMATLRRVLGVGIGIPAPRFLLEIGTALIGTETELVLKSRWVVPETVLDAGYRFEHPELEPALRQIISGRATRH